MRMFSAEVKLQVVLLTMHALAFLALAGWCLARGGSARWAAMGTVGGALLGLAFGIRAASAIENVFFESAHLDQALFVHHHFHTVLLAAQALGAIVLAGAFVESRRTAPVPSESIYGP
jgi:hypothetical protein